MNNSSVVLARIDFEAPLSYIVAGENMARTLKARDL
jgi:hypothetical protein